jgi:ParB family chromosome partitioning protein
VTTTNTVLHEVPVADIRVGTRYRKNLGDSASLAALAKSIKAVGLLQPLVVTPDVELVAGARRLEALKELGWQTVPVRVVDGLSDALAALRAEQDENTCRKDFTRSEAVAIADALRVLEKSKARERKAQAPGKRLGAKQAEEVSPGKLPEEKGDTRDKLAAAVGMSARTLDKATEVVEAAAAEPEKFSDLVQEMDRTGKVDPAHKKLRERGGTRAARKPKAKKANKAPGVPGAVDALNQMVTDGRVESFLAAEVACLPRPEQDHLAGAGPAAVQERAEHLYGLRQILSATEVCCVSSVKPGFLEVSGSEREYTLESLKSGLCELRAACATVEGWIATLQANLPAQDPGEQSSPAGPGPLLPGLSGT